jgi:hypothetical protein
MAHGHSQELRGEGFEAFRVAEPCLNCQVANGAEYRLRTRVRHGAWVPAGRERLGDARERSLS